MSTIATVSKVLERTIVQRTKSGRERILPALPESWTWATVGEIVGVFRGASPRPKGDPRYFGGPIPWIMISDVTRQPGKYLSTTREGVTEAGAELSRRLPAGNLILSNSGTICVPKILRVEGCIHDGFIGFEELENAVDLDFAYWWFEFVRPRMIDENRQGMTQVNLNTDIVREMHFPIAPRREQVRIVAEIEKQISQLESATDALRRVQTNLKRYRASVLKAACEGRLVPTEAELARKEGRGYEPASELLKRILRERRARWEADTLAKMTASGKRPTDDRWKHKYKEPSLPATSALPDLPEGWCWASVEMISTKVVDGVHKKPNYVASGIPFITVRNLTAGPGISFDRTSFITAEDHAEFVKRADPEFGDILISKDGTLGTVRAIRTDRAFSIFVSVAMVKPVLRDMSGYIEIGLMSPQVQVQMVPKGSGLQHIHLEDLREDCIPLPPLQEQTRIVEECSKRLSILDDFEAQIPRAFNRGGALRNSILAHAFSGKLVSQDPTDEPASALLERIRAERKESRTSGRRGKRLPATELVEVS